MMRKKRESVRKSEASKKYKALFCIIILFMVSVSFRILRKGGQMKVCRTIGGA